MLVWAICFFLVVPAVIVIVACYGAAMAKTEWDIQSDLNEQEEYLKAWGCNGFDEESRQREACRGAADPRY